MGKQERHKIIQEELEELAPTLAKLKKTEQPLEVPANYFDQLSVDLMQQIQQQQPTPAPSWLQQWQGFWQQFMERWTQPAYAMALTALIALVIGFSILMRNTPSQDHLQTALSEEDITDYINFNIDNFELSLFVEETLAPSRDADFFPTEDSIEGATMNEYFDELLDDIDLEELL